MNIEEGCIVGHFQTKFLLFRNMNCSEWDTEKCGESPDFQIIGILK
jgi:hypothetical protein